MGEETADEKNEDDTISNRNRDRAAAQGAWKGLSTIVLATVVVLAQAFYKILRRTTAPVHVLFVGRDQPVAITVLLLQYTVKTTDFCWIGSYNCITGIEDTLFLGSLLLWRRKLLEESGSRTLRVVLYPLSCEQQHWINYDSLDKLSAS